MTSYHQDKLPPAFLPFYWLTLGYKHPKPFRLMCCEISPPWSSSCHWGSILPHHRFSRTLDTETCKNKYPGNSCDPFITECCCRAQLRKAGQRKSTCCKGNSGESPGALGRSTLLAALLQLCCSSSQVETDSLAQAWMFKYCREGSSPITAGRQNIKQPKKRETNRSQQWTERPQEHRVPNKLIKVPQRR